MVPGIAEQCSLLLRKSPRSRFRGRRDRPKAVAGLIDGESLEPSGYVNNRHIIMK